MESFFIINLKATSWIAGEWRKEQKNPDQLGLYSFYLSLQPQRKSSDNLGTITFTETITDSHKKEQSDKFLEGNGFTNQFKASLVAAPKLAVIIPGIQAPLNRAEQQCSTKLRRSDVDLFAIHLFKQLYWSIIYI